jgi:hypothetical protein
MEACERAGVPAVGVFGQGFMPMAEFLGDQAGIPRRRLLGYPGMMATDREERLAEVARTVLAPLAIAGLVSDGSDAAPEATAATSARAVSRQIAFRGTLDQVHDHFDARGWLDGLPVVPPTLDRVDRFLAHTALPPHHVFGVLPPEQREATVWTVAVNGVMAGCRPEHMPVLVAIVDALADPVYRLEDAGSTPGWEPLVVISGPAARELDFNSGTGAMRVGRRANTSIGRFVRLFLRNVAGFRIPPGVTDQAGFGMSWNVVMAEDDHAIRELGWTSHREDRGFAADDSVVTVRGCVTISTPIYTHGDDPMEHLHVISHYLAGTIMPSVSLVSLKFGASHNLLAMSPSIARVFRGAGLSKRRICEVLVEETRAPAGFLEYVARQGMVFDFVDLVREGRLPAEYTRTLDPNRMVRLIPSPDDISIVVAGNPDRNQSRAYIGNHVQGVPVTRRIERIT